MKKIMLGLFIGLFIGLFLISFVSAECIEYEDEGKDYYSQGFVRDPEAGEVDAIYDGCMDNGDLKEYYCSDGAIEFIEISCEYDCNDGRCLGRDDVEDVVCAIDFYYEMENNARCKVEYNGVIKECTIKANDNESGNQCILPDMYITKPIPDEGYMPVLGLSGSFEGIQCGEIETSYNTNRFFVNCEPLSACEGEDCIKGDEIKEKITCKFEDSEKQQRCYLAGQVSAEDEGTKFCYADADSGSCVIDYKGFEGEEVIWKSTCGGYQYTTQDSVDEVIYFNCESGETNTTKIEKQGFKNAYFQCYDGEESKSTGREACKSAEFWKKFATNFCESHCKKYKDVEKCGVNSFSISEECYLDEVEESEEEPEGNESETEEGWIEEEILICKNSCPLEDKCYPFGYRKSGRYCSDETNFVDYKDSTESCDNNFECSSNVCINSECISEGFLKKIMNWFRRVFGGD